MTAHVWIGMHTDHMQREDCKHCRAHRIRIWRKLPGKWSGWRYFNTTPGPCPRDWEPSPAERALAEVGRE